MRFSAVLLGACISSVCLGNADAVYGSFAPNGPGATSMPKVIWHIMPTGGSVTRVEMRLNDQSVPASFNPVSNAVEYCPAIPMAPGAYRVNCRVTIADQVVARQDWAFEVGSADPVRANASALAALNAIRARLNLSEFRLDPRMCQAAQAHSAYQSINGETGHYESADRQGFTGKAPWDRVQKFGYPGTCFEGACGGQSDPAVAIRMLFDAPYHRVAFLQPGRCDVGLGMVGQSLTVEYGVSADEGLGMSPAPDQADVPLSWDGVETPTPLRLHGAAGVVGYPIVVSWFSPRLGNASFDSVSLTGPDGQTVPTYCNTPANDPELRFAAILTPRRPLTCLTEYRVQVKGRNDRGARFERSWTFRTAAG